MKKGFLLFIPFFVIVYAQAQTSQLLINENFSDCTIGDLDVSSPGTENWRASFKNSSSDLVQVTNTSPLMYPDYTSGAQYITVAQRGDYFDGTWKYPDDPYKYFKGGNVLINSGASVFYMSFLVRVSSPKEIATTDDARPNIAIRNLNGSQFANFYIAGTADGTHVKFGIHKDAPANGVFADAEYNFNTTYLIVIRYDVANGETSGDYDDKMYLWINPSLASEPSVSSAQVAIDNFWDFNFDGGFNTAAQSLQIFQEFKSATASFDAFRVAYGQGYETDLVNSSAAWNALTPIGEPLPVKLDNLKGFAKNKGIQLEWNVPSSVNVLRYEVERSEDGIHFAFADSVRVINEEGESFYTWLDVSPFPVNNYYRVKAIYGIGIPTYSSVVRVNFKSEASPFSVYPNPATNNHILLQAMNMQRGIYDVEVYTIAGQQVYKKQFVHAGGAINQSIELPLSLKAGLYNIHLSGNGYRLARSVIVR